MDKELNVSDFPIGKYAGYFHDGGMHKILHNDDTVELWMESAEILPEWDWNRDLLPLSKQERICGKLFVSNIINIKKNGATHSSKLKMIYERADIYDLEVEPNKIRLLVTWEQYLPERKQTDMFDIEIEAEEIWWENDPTLFSEYWDSF